MKIYTKIIYKWIDGQLVETSSESFEYKGHLTLCGGGGGGGGGKGGGGSSGGLGGSLGDAVSSVTGAVSDVGEQVENVVTDPVGTVAGSLEPIGDLVTDVKEGVLDPVISAITPQSEIPFGDMPAPEEEEEEDKASGKGTADRLKGIGASLAHKTKTGGAQGKFTRGSLRVRRPTSTMKA